MKQNTIKAHALTVLFCAAGSVAPDHGYPFRDISIVKNQITHYSLINETMKTDSVNMVLTRTIDAPVEKVWKAWSEELLVKQWWGPRGFTAPVAKMDFRIGGKSLVCMRAPQGFEIYNTWTYTKIVLMQQIEFVHHFSDKEGNKISPSAIGMPPGIPESVPHVIILKANSDGKTDITITEYGYGSKEDAELSKAGMSECIDKMEECLRRVK